MKINIEMGKETYVKMFIYIFVLLSETKPISYILGDKRVQISEGYYFSVKSHNEKVYASNYTSGSIEIYAHKDDIWWGLRRIQTSRPNHYVRLCVNNVNIFASSWHNKTTCVYSHDGTLLSDHRRTEELKTPLVCHGDQNGDVLIADWSNHCLQVLRSDGNYSRVGIHREELSWPDSAVYYPGRLFVLNGKSTKDPPNETRLSVFLPTRLLLNAPQKEESEY